MSIEVKSIVKPLLARQRSQDWGAGPNYKGSYSGPILTMADTDKKRKERDQYETAEVVPVSLIQVLTVAEKFQNQRKRIERKV